MNFNKGSVMITRLCLILLCSGNVLNANEHIKIDSGTLRTLDNAQYVNIAQLLMVAKKLQDIQLGQTNRNDNKRNGLFKYKDTFYSLRQLVSIEAVHEHLTKDDQRILKKLREDVIDSVKKVSKVWEGWERLKTHHKDALNGVLNQWCTQRKKPNSFLKKWGEMGEDQFVDRHMQTFENISAFVDDLLLFLLDVKETCPSSTQLFEEMRKNKKQS